jgi:hypothetical protein
MMRMRLQMRTKNHCKPMIDQCRMWRTKGIVGLTCKPVMSRGMSVRMATMQIWMRKKTHHKAMIDQLRMWRTEGIVRESVKIEQYISDM